MSSDKFGPDANAPVAFGAIAQIENLIGAPLSDGVKQLIEQVVVQSLTFGVQIASESIRQGQAVAEQSSMAGADMARKAADIGHYVATGKAMEAAYPEPAAA